MRVGDRPFGRNLLALGLVAALSGATAGLPSSVLRGLLALGLSAALSVAPALATAEDDPPADAAAFDELVDDSDRDHWAFVPLARPPLPRVERADWCRNALDRFVLAEWESRGWPLPEAAPPEALLRRVYLDLLGLPPTPAEQDAFLTAPTDEAFDRVVAELLARPSYGERWARHWLDLVRYADSNGYERDAAKPEVWRYRDWVIRALNEDRPWDRFVLEQLAGDELADADSDTRIATGYYRLGPWDDEPADPAQDRFDQLDDIVRTTGEVFLGLTIGCARCHDHRFEPLTQLDYYRLLAVFDPLERPTSGRTELALPAGSPVQVAHLAACDRQIAELEARRAALIDAWRHEYAASGRSALPDEVLAALLLPPDERDEAQAQRAAQYESQFEAELVAARPEALVDELHAIDSRIAAIRSERPDLPPGYYLHETSPAAATTHLLVRGSPSRPGLAVDPGVPTVLSAVQPAFLPAGETSTQRRLTLAQWLVDPHNALAARVVVNRVWQQHFGQALVATSSDFGYMSAGASHPELLDWLAGWFLDRGGSLKALHRLILESRTYRISSAPRQPCASDDPENLLLWRFPYRRLEVEAIRDSILAASGQLRPEMYGPSVFPHVPPEALAGNSDPETIWPAEDDAAAARRSIYVFVKRGLVWPMFDVLDFCDTTRSVPQRMVTSVAPQALTMFNGHFVNQQAAHLADRLLAEGGDEPSSQICLAYRLTLCRPPTADEIGELTAFLVQQAEYQRQSAAAPSTSTETDAAPATTSAEACCADAHRAAWVQAARVLFNLNEFVYPE